MRKRLVIDVREADHRKLKKKALELNTSLANYVRRALGLPEERHGVKTESASAKVRSRKVRERKRAERFIWQE